MRYRIWLGIRFFIASVFVVSMLSSCATIPTKEFASYKDAFKSARDSSEQVLVDYAAAKKEEDINKADAAVKELPRDIIRPTNFDPVQVASDDFKSVDAIEVRMKAWDVVARYNDALTLLAEGKSVQEVAAATEGLI